MYEFRDTIDTSESNSILPSEAMRINGEYIEDLIPGYRTLSVAGREALSPEINSISTGARDGSILQNKRFPERIITIQYQLIATSNAEFRNAYNELGRILNVTDAEIVFADEDDKFFIGTPYTIEEVDPGSNAVIGNFEILCTDPFKYSILEHYAIPDLDEGSVLIDYNGTYKSYPTLVANFAEDSLGTKGECGFIAFYDENQNVIQVGDPDEVDGKNFDSVQNLDTSVFNNYPSQSETAAASIAKWAVNTCAADNGVTTSGKPDITLAVPESYTSDYNYRRRILDKTSTVSEPDVNYKVSVTTYSRTANSVRVHYTVTASLTRDSSYFLTGYILKAALYIGGAWHEVTVKRSTDKWRGKTAHTVSKTLTVTGLASDQTLITNVQFKAYRGDNNGTCGTLNATKCANVPISAYSGLTSGTMYMFGVHQNELMGEANIGYGVGSRWHGPAITLTLPNDQLGNPCGDKWDLNFMQMFAVSANTLTTNPNNEFGAFQMKVRDANGVTIAGFNIWKVDYGKSINVQYVVNNQVVKTVTVNNGAMYGKNAFVINKRNRIAQVGNTVKFWMLDKVETFINDGIENTSPVSVSFYFLAYDSRIPVAYNGIYRFSFSKTGCDTWGDLPNIFASGDTLEVDCKNGNIIHNGVISPQLGALGNDWERFYLTPGLNQIGFAYSDWVEEGYEPNIKLRYREVFL